MKNNRQKIHQKQVTSNIFEPVQYDNGIENSGELQDGIADEIETTKGA